MVKNILSFVVGYVLWTAIFLGGASVLRILFSDVHDDKGYTSDTTTLVIYLVISFIASLAAGYVAAWIAGSSKTIMAGVLAACLLATGIPVQLSTWNELPVWYNLVFLFGLVPLTLIGAALTTSNE